MKKLTKVLLVESLQDSTLVHIVPPLTGRVCSSHHLTARSTLMRTLQTQYTGVSQLSGIESSGELILSFTGICTPGPSCSKKKYRQ